MFVTLQDIFVDFYSFFNFAEFWLHISASIVQIQIFYTISLLLRPLPSLEWMITGVQIQYYVWKSEINWVEKCHCALARQSRLWRQQPSSLSFVFGPLRFHGKFAKITRRGNGGGAAIVVVNANRLVTLRILSIRQIQTMFDPVLIISFHTFQPTLKFHTVGL